ADRLATLEAVHQPERFVDAGGGRETDILPHGLRREVLAEAVEHGLLALAPFGAEGSDGLGRARHVMLSSWRCADPTVPRAAEECHNFPPNSANSAAKPLVGRGKRGTIATPRRSILC